jgi:hypothetical protein
MRGKREGGGPGLRKGGGRHTGSFAASGFSAILHCLYLNTNKKRERGQWVGP